MIRLGKRGLWLRRIRRKSQRLAASLAIPAAIMGGALAEEEVPDPGMAKVGAKVLAGGWKSSWSPDASEIVYGGKLGEDGDEARGGLVILMLATGKTRLLVEAGKDPAWSPGKGKHIAYVASGAGSGEEVWVVGSDGRNPRKLDDGGFPSWGKDPQTVIYHSRHRKKLMSVRIDAKEPQPQELMPMKCWYPAISRDGRHVAYRTRREVRVADIETGEILERLPFEGGRGFLGGWSPRGRYLCFGGFGAHDVFGLHLADLRTGKIERITEGNFTMADWSRDGSRIVVDHRTGGGQKLYTFEPRNLGKLVVEDARNATPPEIRRWVDQLGDDSFLLREEASRALEKIGVPAMEALRDALKNPDTGVEIKLRARKLLNRFEHEERFSH